MSHVQKTGTPGDALKNKGISAGREKLMKPGKKEIG